MLWDVPAFASENFQRGELTRPGAIRDGVRLEVDAHKLLVPLWCAANKTGAAPAKQFVVMENTHRRGKMVLDDRSLVNLWTTKQGLEDQYVTTIQSECYEVCSRGKVGVATSAVSGKTTAPPHFRITLSLEFFHRLLCMASCQHKAKQNKDLQQFDWAKVEILIAAQGLVWVEMKTLEISAVCCVDEIVFEVK